MLKRIEHVGEKRMLSKSELAAYIGLGESRAIEFAKNAGAVRHIGTRALYDKKLIDEALDALMEA